MNTPAESSEIKVAFAVFVKTPGMSPIKTRLAETLGQVPAERFYLRSLAVTRETIENVCHDLHSQQKSGTRPLRITPYWAVAERLGVTHRLWAGWQTIEQGDGELGERLANVYHQLRQTHDIVCLYGADSPHILSNRLIEGIECLVRGEADAAAGPTEDGGFYFFASSLVLEKDIWIGVPYSSTETLARLRDRVRPGVKLGWYELPLEFDVDTAADYQRAAAIEKRLHL